MDHLNETPQFGRQIWEFQSYAHFEQFRDALRGEVDAGRMTEVEVEGSPRYWNERWFTDQTGRTWRLAPPDAPFKGRYQEV